MFSAREGIREKLAQQTKSLILSALLTAEENWAGDASARHLRNALLNWGTSIQDETAIDLAQKQARHENMSLSQGALSASIACLILCVMMPCKPFMINGTMTALLWKNGLPYKPHRQKWNDHAHLETLMAHPLLIPTTRINYGLS